MKIRRIIPAFLSAAIFLASSTVAFAQDNVSQTPVNEQIRVGDYDCYVENGQYYTELDGEKCLVINLDDYDSSYISAQQSANASEYRWLDERQTVKLSYSGSVDVSKGDFTTPVFLASEKDEGYYCGFQIGTGFWRPTSYTIDLYYYNSYPGINKWQYTPNVKITFTLLAQNKILFTGTAVHFYKKACLVFHQVDSNHSNPVFNYTMYSCY